MAANWEDGPGEWGHGIPPRPFLRSALKGPRTMKACTDAIAKAVSEVGVRAKDAAESMDAFSRAFNGAKGPQPARKEWKLSEAVETWLEGYTNTQHYRFPDGTLHYIGHEKLRRFSVQGQRDIRVPANPPKGAAVDPINITITGSADCSSTATYPFTGYASSKAPKLGAMSRTRRHWSDPDAFAIPKPTPLTPRQWLNKRVGEVMALGRVETGGESEYQIRGIVHSGAA